MDLRALNLIMIKDKHSLPNIKQSIENLYNKNFLVK